MFNIVDKYMQNIQKEQAQAEANANADTTSTTDDKKDDNVVDAEYEEK